MKLKMMTALLGGAALLAAWGITPPTATDAWARGWGASAAVNGPTSLGPAQPPGGATGADGANGANGTNGGIGGNGGNGGDGGNGGNGADGADATGADGPS